MTADVSIAAALFAGVLSFLSPCVLPLVPPYLVYLAGASLERLADAEPEPMVRADTVFAALLFVAGFSTVFIAFGASASAIGALVQAWSGELGIVAGIAIIVMGLHFLGFTRFAVLMREKRVPMSRPVAVHRGDPCRHPGGGGLQGDSHQGRRAARHLFRRPRHSLHLRSARRRALRRLHRALQAPSGNG